MYHRQRILLYLPSSMATAQTSIPLPDLDDADKAIVFLVRDEELNSTILYSLLSGVYTGVVAITLGSIFMNKAQPIRRSMVVVIVLLHIVTMLNFGFVWKYIDSMFIGNGSNFWTEYLFFSSSNMMLEVGMGTTSVVCTILADSTMIVRCWMVWGRRWLSILLPIFLLFAAIVFKILGTYVQIADPLDNSTLFITLYTSFILATTLWCTLLIIYRIVTVAQIGNGVRAYRNVIEILVESSALYSIFLILYMIFATRTFLHWLTLIS
ncbi:uncharacterized protein EV420DRAFT_799764 [Desarmillaria tabescens]|uniref:Uncharacterized protein n=1 Tax=Armillaria tabescens TaxID=1929756 RepID=A0AA39NHT1_ARMTA|nr:uncharacterized protein EV420DRAFT_799764 [Desarmillaria tabescens]KAK0465892.1 hypothetical protein EV420DRAFT_799764 [Desarmillaria tabescens]